MAFGDHRLGGHKKRCGGKVQLEALEEPEREAVTWHTAGKCTRVSDRCLMFRKYELQQEKLHLPMSLTPDLKGQSSRVERRALPHIHASNRWPLLQLAIKGGSLSYCDGDFYNLSIGSWTETYFI